MQKETSYRVPRVSLWQILSVLAIVAMVVSALQSSVLAAGRVALVVGNGAYEKAPGLTNPSNDAKLIAKSLRQVGFDVVSVFDGDYTKMRKSLQKFGRLATNADVALFYYAGHGLQVAGRNWLLPIDADIESSTDLPASAIKASSVLELMELSGAKARIAILDACRNNPLSRSLSRATSRGLAQIDSSAAGSMIIFATQPGNVALDGSGKNSPFSKALAKEILTPGIEIRQMMGRVRKHVMDDTNDKQVPWVNEAIVGEIYMASAPVENKTPAPQVVAQQNDSSNKMALELAFWDSVKSSNNPLMIQLYLNRFPDGVFAKIANLQIASMEKKSADRKISVEAKPEAVQNPVVQRPIVQKPVVQQPTTKTASLAPTALLKSAVDDETQMKTKILSFVKDYQQLSSDHGRLFVAGLNKYYADSVNFYGNQADLLAIQNDKKNFVTKWPSRSYVLDENQLQIDCYPNSQICTVEGIVDWQVANHQANSNASGKSSIFYEVEFFDNGPRIVVEDSEVLKRN